MEKRKLFAYAWATGLIEFGPKVPKGALAFAQGEPEKLREAVTTVCRHGYKDNEYLVPGVPEAGLHSDDAVDALIAFEERVRLFMEAGV